MNLGSSLVDLLYLAGYPFGSQHISVFSSTFYTFCQNFSGLSPIFLALAFKRVSAGPPAEIDGFPPVFEQVTLQSPENEVRPYKLTLPTLLRSFAGLRRVNGR
jgi:hypothetical protein